MPFPIIEDSIQATESGVQLLVAPSEASSMEIQIFEAQLVHELSECEHEATVDV